MHGLAETRGPKKQLDKAIGSGGARDKYVATRKRFYLGLGLGVC